MTTNVVVVVFAVVAIGVLVKNYFAPQGVKTSGTVTKGSAFPEIAPATFVPIIDSAIVLHDGPRATATKRP